MNKVLFTGYRLMIGLVSVLAFQLAASWAQERTARDIAGDVFDDVHQGVAGWSAEDLVRKKLIERGILDPNGPIPDTLKGKVKDAAVKSIPSGAATVGVLAADLAGSAGQAAGGDYRQAFAEASGSFASAAAGFLASSVVSGAFAPVAAGITAGFVAKQGVRALAESYNAYQTNEDVYAALARIEPKDSLRARMGKLQEDMEKARTANKPDSVAGIAQEQRKVLADYKTHQDQARKMSASLTKMSAAIRQGQLDAAQKHKAWKEQERIKSGYHQAWREADDKREEYARALAKATKSGKFQEAQLTAARAKLAELEAATKNAWSTLQKQERVEQEFRIERNHAMTAVESMQEFFSDQVREFKINAERMYGEVTAEKMTERQEAKALDADGEYEMIVYDRDGKPTETAWKLKIAGTQVTGSFKTKTRQGPMSGEFDPVSRTLTFAYSLPHGEGFFEFGLAAKFTGTLDGTQISGSFAHILTTATGNQHHSNGTWKAKKR